MDFDYSPRQQALMRRIGDFMDEHIYPAVPIYEQQDGEGGRWKVIPILEHDGYSVTAVQIPLTSLPDDIALVGFHGLEVGQFRISLARILLGIVLFIVLLFATRLLQRWLREKALNQTRMDPGIANSIDTVAGYVGTALAALVAISYAGLDITNLAIVAGALSVGIGFGLQSIVNNFVSGLILLWERAVRVGDWIVVGGDQGFVLRINAVLAPRDGVGQVFAQRLLAA